MKYSVYASALLLVAVALLVPSSSLARDPHSHDDDGNNNSRARARDDGSGNELVKTAAYSNGKRKQMEEDERNAYSVQTAGSRLPDCSHACGSCWPCKLVIVSSCASIAQAAETCPLSYRCMCNNKSYPVP